ncbi:MAG: porin [Candidatus Scalindua sp.]|nr:porin [Candidatus Scalindua sp.]
MKRKIMLYLPLFAVLVLSLGSVTFAQETSRERMKAELKEELKAELLEEIRQEMLKEVAVETRADAQRAAREASIGFREELRSEIIEQSKSAQTSSIRSEIAKWAEESPFLSAFKDVTLSGFVDVNYMYNFDLHGDTAQRQNSLTTGADGGVNFIGENENDSFTFQSFALFFDKQVTDEHPIGWQVHTYWGEFAKRITFYGEKSGLHGTNDVDRDDIFTVSAANISWEAPIGKGITFTMGKMYTWIGLELVENIGNPNYQHGILYNNAIPFTHTGISMDLSNYMPEGMTMKLYGVNGWDSNIDNNESKSFGWYLSYEPNENWFVSLGGIHGNEGWEQRSGRAPTDQREDTNGGLTQMVDFIVSWQTPVDKLKLMLNVDYGMVEDGKANTIDTTEVVSTGDGHTHEEVTTSTVVGKSNAHWWGAAAYAIYDFTDQYQLATRWEYFDDADGLRFFGQTMWDFTATLNIKLHENLLLRPEYRYIHFNKDSVGTARGHADTDGLDKDAHIAGLGVEYVF